MTDYRVRARSQVKRYFRRVLRLATAAALLCAGLAGMARAARSQHVTARGRAAVRAGIHRADDGRVRAV